MKRSKAVAGSYMCSQNHRIDTECGECGMHRAQRYHVHDAHKHTAWSREHMNEAWLHVISQDNSTPLIWAACLLLW